MRSIYSLLLLTIILFAFSACSTANSDLVVAEYGNYKIDKDDFKKAYIKSVGGLEEAKDDSLSQLKSYLDLYLNYKMKLRDTEVRGYDKDETVQKELEDYKNQIGKSFIEERYITAPGIKKLYEDDKYEYKFRHILVKADTISRKRAYALALELIDRLNNGEDFASLAKKYSGDVATRDAGGEIYYLKISQMPLANFADVLLECPAGKVYQKPVLSTAGYHIINVIDKKPVRYRIRASHIIRDFKNEAGQPDTANALAIIQEVKKQLDEGVAFDSLALKYSEDPGSKSRGGDLGSFPRRSMVVEFDSAVFNLKVGEVSDIIKTRFGYHIAKCTEEEEMPPFDKLEPDLRKFFVKNVQSYRLEQFKDKLKAEYGLKINKDVYPFVQSQFDSTLLGDEYLTSDFRNKIKSETAFQLQGKDYNLDYLLGYYLEKGNRIGTVIDSTLVKNLVNNRTEDLLFETKMNDMEKNDPEFADIIEEYRNGILIFKLQEEEVWSKIKVDSVGMYNYYENHKSDYQWGPRVSYKAILSNSDSLINKIYSSINDNNNFEEMFKQFSEAKERGIKTETVELVDVEKDVYSKKADSMENIGDISPVFQTGKKEWSFIQLTAKHEPAPKTFEEAQNEVAGPYQEILTKAAEQEYIDRLDSVYKPVKHYEALENMFK